MQQVQEPLSADARHCFAPIGFAPSGTFAAQGAHSHDEAARVIRLLASGLDKALWIDTLGR